MTKAIEYEDWCYDVVNSCCNEIKGRGGDNFTGPVFTPHGIVNVQIWATLKRPITLFVFIHNQREHHRRYDGRLTVLGAVRKAVEFAREIVEGK